MTCTGLALGLSMLFAAEAAPEELGGRFVEHAARLPSGESTRFAVWLPPGFVRDRYWPAVVFLHGEHESGTDNVRQTQVGLGPVLRAGHRVWQGVVVFPQKPDAQVLWSARADLVLGVLAAARAAYPIDVRRIYLTGLAQGGEGTWGIAAANPGTFAALAPVAGWSESPDVAARALAGTPVWLFHGGKDTVVPARRAQRIAGALQREGRAPRITVYPEEGHEIWDRTYRRRDLQKWLFRKRLVRAPEGP
jgi:predicted peptidase